jgi:hypothetical protein
MLRYGRRLVVGEPTALACRHPPRPANAHAVTFLTSAPNRLWSTNVSMVQAVKDGVVRVFAALAPFNSEIIGHYDSTGGSRFVALEPIGQAVRTRSGGIEAERARCYRACR